MSIYIVFILSIIINSNATWFSLTIVITYNVIIKSLLTNFRKRSRRDLEGSADDEYYDAEYDEDDIDGDGVEEDVTAKFANAVDLTTARSVNSVTPAVSKFT